MTSFCLHSVRLLHDSPSSQGSTYVCSMSLHLEQMLSEQSWASCNLACKLECISRCGWTADVRVATSMPAMGTILMLGHG